MAGPEGKESKPSRGAVTLKTPKGTRDWSGPDMLLRDEVFKSITDVFKRHGGTPLDTPVFELKEILAGKYGEDSRLMYDLEDQGGELCSLRFDLTVPFARWLAMNNIQQVKRYTLAKVYRRDQPAIARGRLREFHQCDFDIAGVYDPMIPDAETLRIIVEVFEALDLGITIKLNHRKILDGLFAVAGVPADKIRSISSAVDKLDKMAWPDVKKEMVEEKGLPEDVADRIGEYVRHSGTVTEMVDFLRANETLSANESVKAGLDDMALLGSYLKALDVIHKINFDLSLARGLDYYTGLIYEVINLPPKNDDAEGNKKSKKDDPANQVGSIAAGGRYDNLVGMYGKRTIPCVGISFGVDRIFTILKARRERENAAKARGTDVYVMAFGGKEFEGLLLERMDVARRLWNAGIRAEFSPKVKPKLPQQFKAAEDVPLGVILGKDELAAGQVRLKSLGQGDDKSDKDRGILVKLDDLADEVKKLLL
ncbi:histidyl-tRNA synthetase domain-containing protein [Hirsutella rhossiliensis]|uniref:Histidine--tRNA ligase, mitochondrial n=1 Tax=Hirsutella rhossiliensis TaxID=111463 RepID=A0A9P8MTM2_9HYPO|nr:histidyl-tRNA synthetase domain-containing protein [Hirsutella rhossiliensis]KAH0961020.1 histidyl-tRNA synthetase domain-containing protein [Hirsutella rhossiliensis]